MARKDPEIEAAEDMLCEAWECLMRSPDRERGFLLSGQRSWWPAIIRDPVTDYAEQEAPRRPLTRREIALRDRVFIAPDALVMRLTVDSRALLAIVLLVKRRAMGEDGLWQTVLGVWRKLPGKAKLGTADGLRVQYRRILDTVARWEAAALVDVAARID